MINFSDKKLEEFMLESNRIEGEDRLNPDDMDAIKFAILNGLNTIDRILYVHSMLGHYLKVDWVGKFRKCNVGVGGYFAPEHWKVEALMENYVKDLSSMDSWEAHNRFEIIHPFRDLNGRTGRLIWLSKAVDEGYRFQRKFLHEYYYQTLSKQR